jgi:hypothetical protein
MNISDIEKTEKTILAIHCNNMSNEDVDTFTTRIKASGKPSKIAASFNKISDLQLEHLKHFVAAPYFWKPMQGNIWGGMLADEKIDYIHLVLASEEVVNVLLNKNKIENLILTLTQIPNQDQTVNN